MKKPADPQQVTRRGLAIAALAALLVAGLGLGVAQGGSPVLTKKAAKKAYFTKKKANKRFLTKTSAANQYQQIQRKLQVPASQAGFDRNDVDTNYGDTNGAAAGAQHLNTGFGNIGWSFVLPPHYPAGTPLNVKIYYAVTATGCNFNLEPNSLSVNNIGANVAGSQNDIVNGPDILAAPPAQQVASVDWTIPGTVQGQALQPGTAVTYGTFRNSTDAGDNCAGIVAIKGAEVSWG